MSDFISEVDILDEAKDNFLTYAAEVLTDRAVPSAEDGLLSSQRKLIWTMEEYLKMNSKSKTKKCQGIVGATLQTSYFHGDAACYGVLCKMSQKFLARYPLVTGQGALGTQASNDLVSSSRYTEAKPSAFGDLMMNDFKKNVVPTKETYNAEFFEPVILPALFPNAICNGKQAIAISLAHSSLPHNLTEACNAIIKYIEQDGLTIDELLEIMPGPDFPLHNIVVNSDEIKTAFETGKSKTSLRVRGHYTISDDKIIFDTIPYRTYRDKIAEQLAKNADVFDEVLEDYVDNSNLGQNRLVFTVKKGINPEVAVNKIFALTDLQTTVSYNMNYIVNGTPKMCSMLDLIKYYIEHQNNILIKIAEFDKQKAEARRNILEGLILIIPSIDKAIEIIRNSYDKEEAVKKLVEHFKINKEQAEAVLEMKLSRLTKMNKDELIKELEEKKAIIADCTKVIKDKSYRSLKLINKVKDMRDKYGDDRRTELLNIEYKENKEDKNQIIPEDVVIAMTSKGELKRIAAKEFKPQRRGGKGIKTKGTNDNYDVHFVSTNTIDTLLLFSNLGKMYRIIVDKIPEMIKGKGTSITSLVELDKNEKIITIAPFNCNKKYILFTTKNGIVKKTNLEEYKSIKKSCGTIAIKLKEGDSIVSIDFIDENDDICIITKNGSGIKFKQDNINATGRNTIGVKGIILSDKDEVAAVVTFKENTTDNLAIFVSNGKAKKIKIDDFNYQLRGGKGVFLHKEDSVVSAIMINDEDNIVISGITNSICISGKEIPERGRLASGVNVIDSHKILSAIKL